MEFTLVFKDHEGWFLKDTCGNYYPFKFPAPGIGAGGGSGISRRGVIVENQGVSIGRMLTLNFTGAGVTATDGGNELANITIPGNVIQSLTTAQRLALIPTTALIVEDTDLDMYFKWSTVSNAWSPF